MELIVFVGNDKDNWGQITALINRMESDKIVLVKGRQTENFPANEKCEIVEIDSGKPLVDLKEEIKDKLRSKLSGIFEVALSIASGTGKEHMALISALLSIPVGVRFAVFTKNGVEFIN